EGVENGVEVDGSVRVFDMQRFALGRLNGVLLRGEHVALLCFVVLTGLLSGSRPVDVVQISLRHLNLIPVACGVASWATVRVDHSIGCRPTVRRWASRTRRRRASRTTGPGRTPGPS